MTSLHYCLSVVHKARSNQVSPQNNQKDSQGWWPHTPVVFVQNILKTLVSWNEIISVKSIIWTAGIVSF